MNKGFHSISQRVFLLFLFCMAGILLIVTLLYYNRTTAQFQEKISDLSRKNVAQTVGLFDLMYNGYDSLSKSLSNKLDMVRLFNEKTDEPALEYINERSITTIIGALFYSRDDMFGIHVLADKGKIYNYGNYMNVVDEHYRDEQWYDELHNSSGKMVWLGVYPHSLIDKVEQRSVFAFGRQIFDLNEHKPIGIVLYESDPAPILAALNNLKLGKHSQVYIVSGDGRIVSGIQPEMPDLKTLPKLEESENIVVQHEVDRLVVASRLPFADWSVVSITPNKDLNVEMVEMKRYLLIVASILILVSAIIGSFVSRTISKPLKQLIREMKQVEIGNFRRVLNVTSYKEINILVASFNGMVLRIEELIERVKVSSVSEKNAELLALQSQVNPHFLYNTLDMIYWMMDEKGNDRLGELVLSLSHMFRYSSHWEEGKAVTLREEVEQIGHYLTIILIRLEGRLQVEIDIDEKWLDIPIPRMTVQPIIENAVKHGLESLDRVPGLLKVYTRAEGQTLRIMIEDNGNGMSKEQLVRLIASLERETPAGKSKGGIGLQNLHLRLKYMFGEAYGLELESELGAGTIVTIVLPLMKEGEVNA
ncbi:MAG: sensor histidine kinase [Gorillibacterium sp.]|nr:sensor histidine kinase [Gorillibacterium sp.]